MSAVGVDISDRSVKYLELGRHSGRRIIRRFGERPIPAGVVEKGNIVATEALTGILRDLKKEARADFIRASLPEEHAYVFQIEVPEGTADAELRTLLEFKLEEHVPIPVREAVFDYQVFESHGAPPHREVAVSVYARSIIDGYLAAFSAAGLVPLSLEVEAEALARAVLSAGDAGTHLLVDFGHLRTGIAIVSRGALLFTTTISIGGEPISAAVAKHLSLSGAAALRFKNEEGLRHRGNAEFTMALTGAVSALRDEVNKHLIYWRTRQDSAGDPMPEVQDLVLCGGSSNLAGLSEYLSGSLQLPAVVANVWRNVLSFDEEIPPIDRAHSLGFATAVGLALRER